MRGVHGHRAEVPADAGRVLAVEDVLRRVRAERPDQAADLLRAPVHEAVLDLGDLVVAAAVAAPPDRQPRRHPVLHVEVPADRVAGLVDGDRAALVLRVGLADRDAGLDRRHRLQDVLAREHRAPVGMRVGQRQRAHLVDHRRRVAGGDARELVARLRRVQRLLVRDLRDVEVEDVAPVLPRGRAEVDVAAHAARAGERRVERLQRDVAGPDEVDLLLARLRRLERRILPKTRCGITYRASTNVLNFFVRNFLRSGGSSMPSITTSSWLSA